MAARRSSVAGALVLTALEKAGHFQKQSCKHSMAEHAH